MIRTVAFALFPVLLLAQQRDTSSTPAVPEASGIISGIVQTAGANGQVVRRALVTMTGGGVPARSTLSDDNGRFTFARVPPGSFSVTARKAAYLAAQYGARKPGRSGMPIALSIGQHVDIELQMFRGAVIAGTLRDGAGAPVGGVQVRVIDARIINAGTDSQSADVAATDDRGVFRIYGLMAGDYYVVALPMPSGSGEITAPSVSAIDAALAALDSRRQTASGVPTRPSPPQRPIGFAPIYFPGTPNYLDAARVHVGAAEEREDVNFELRSVPMAAIDGVVQGDVPNLAAVQVSINPLGPRVATVISSNSLAGMPINEQGRFRYSNLPPGRYRLVARANRTEAITPRTPAVSNGVSFGGGGGTPPSSAGPGEFLFAFADVDINGADIGGVTLALQPGGSISGRIVFTGTKPKPEDPSTLRLNLTGETGLGYVSANGLMMGTGQGPITTINSDGTFEIRAIGPGRYTLSGVLPNPTEAASWKLRSAMIGQQNVVEEMIELSPGVNVRDVVVEFSDAHTEIAGTLQSPTGTLVTENYIVAVPVDRALWRPRSRRIVAVRPATDGRFVFADLPAGEYVIAALTDLDALDLMDPAFLAEIAGAGVKVHLAEGEKKVQNLKIG